MADDRLIVALDVSSMEAMKSEKFGINLPMHLVWLSTRSISLTRCTCSQLGHLTPCSRPWKSRQKMWSLS